MLLLEITIFVLFKFKIATINNSKNEIYHKSNPSSFLSCTN